MSNHFCHLCGGLVDLIKLQPQGVRLCDCADANRKLKARIKELKELVQSRDNAICALIDDDTKDNRISELEAIIKTAPHRADCRKLDPYYKASSNICNCWKSKVEKAQ